MPNMAGCISHIWACTYICTYWISVTPHLLHLSGYDLQDDNLGYAAGNKTLDSIMMHFVHEARDCFYNGAPSLNGKFFLVFLRLEGDLPAQGKLSHSARNFTNDPNPMCPWCLADDRLVPFADLRERVAWRATTGSVPPWGSISPLHYLPGGNDEQFLAKDLFHISHVGITRTFCGFLHLLFGSCWPFSPLAWTWAVGTLAVEGSL